VHVDPVSGGEYLVRMRVDGKLERYCTLSRNVAEHLVNRLKILAHLDIADPFRPKEGRLILPPSLAELEVRMTTVPVADGEAVALRVFAKDSIFFNLEELGFSADSLERVVEMVQRGEGLVLVTGPTGSGKSTTVYSILHSLTRDEQVIVSIEDPVEFSVPFVRQMSVDPRHGTSMVEGLRTILRMDPDAIFVGEIRDPDAADIAMRAASSGRYVLSTLHTRDVASTVTSLRDLGVTDRSISANLTGAVNQRLQRRLCPECRTPVEPNDDQKRTFEQHQVAVPEYVFTRKGCPACRETGYHGRVGVFETALINDDVKAAIAAGRPEFDIQQLLTESGMRLLMTDALQKAADGITDFEEAIQVHWLG
jgi:type II secretory ATPase GspE/PulE/Tfp pilus assembly ATPase PilB-like protein